jgi:histidine ammonia-lyase
MGTIAARKATEVLYNLKKVLAIELLCACQGIDISAKGKLGIGTHIAYELVRSLVPALNEDREMYIDIERIADLIDSNVLVDAVMAL